MNSLSQKPLVIILTALAIEARVLIDRYGLKKDKSITKLDAYAGKNGELRLIVSGVNGLNSAMATGLMFAHTGSLAHTVFLNIGTAGASSADLQQLYLASSIQGEEHTAKHYPNVLKGFNYLPLTSRHQAASAIPEHTMVDMEAYGFYAAASRVVDNEQIHACKLISDAGVLQDHKMSKATVLQLFQDNLPSIEQLISLLLEVSQQRLAQEFTPAYWQDFIRQWHFSVYQQAILYECLRRAEIKRPDELLLEQCSGLETSKQVLQFLGELTQ